MAHSTGCIGIAENDWIRSQESYRRMKMSMLSRYLITNQNIFQTSFMNDSDWQRKIMFGNYKSPSVSNNLYFRISYKMLGFSYV